MSRCPCASLTIGSRNSRAERHYNTPLRRRASALTNKGLDRAGSRASRAVPTQVRRPKLLRPVVPATKPHASAAVCALVCSTPATLFGQPWVAWSDQHPRCCNTAGRCATQAWAATQHVMHMCAMRCSPMFRCASGRPSTSNGRHKPRQTTQNHKPAPQAERPLEDGKPRYCRLLNTMPFDGVVRCAKCQGVNQACADVIKRKSPCSQIVLPLVAAIAQPT